MTETEIKEELTLYRNARNKILLGGQESSADGTSVKRASLETIEKKIKELEQKLAIVQNGGRINSSPVRFLHTR